MANTSSVRGSYTRVSSAVVSKYFTSLAPKDEVRKTKSWRAPVTMLAAWMAGLGVALAHHLINTHLDGKEVAWRQPVISQLGAALAFMVKMFLTASIEVAFVQRQWRKFHHQTFKLKDVDTLTSILGNGFSFLGYFMCDSMWIRHPILTLLAMISWSVAVSTSTIPTNGKRVISLLVIIAPSSLSVMPIRTSNSTMLQVPQLAFNRTAYSGSTRKSSAWMEVFADDRLYKLAYSAASSAQPVSLPSKYQNETYHLIFHGPTVKCDTANNSVILNMTEDFGSVPGDHPSDAVLFASWVAGDESSLRSESMDFKIQDQYSPDAARIFVMSQLGSWSDLQDNSINGTRNTRVNVTECLLYNATYSVDFEFQYSQQKLRTSILSYLNPIPPFTYQTVKGSGGSGQPELTTSHPAADVDGAVCYLATMSVFSKLLVGIRRESDDKMISASTSFSMLSIDWERAESVQSGLEQLFHNFTLSLLSDTALIKNSTQADLVPVTVTSWPITYSYEPLVLLIVYGLSFLSALQCSIIGMHAFAANDASYQNLFSTFVRATNNLELRSLVATNDSGSNPLPKDLAEAKFTMGTRGEQAMIRGPD